MTVGHEYLLIRAVCACDGGTIADLRGCTDNRVPLIALRPPLLHGRQMVNPSSSTHYSKAHHVDAGASLADDSALQACMDSGDTQVIAGVKSTYGLMPLSRGKRQIPAGPGTAHQRGWP